MAEINIEQRPDDDVTVIEGTIYHNDLLRTLGQTGLAQGPFVITSRADGVIGIRTITQWPEPQESERLPGSGLAKLREVATRRLTSRATIHITEDGRTRMVSVDGMRLPNVAVARTEHEPEQISRLVVSINVSEIETVNVPNNWWPT